MISSGRLQCHMGCRFVFFSLAFSILIFVISILFLSFRYISMTFFKKMSFVDILLCCLSFVPRLIVLSISVGFIVGFFFYYSNICRRGYDVAMHSFGMSPFFFLKPPLFVVCITSMVVFVLSISFFPFLVTIGKTTEKSMRHQVDVAFFMPRILFQWNKSLFYAHHKQADGVFRGIVFVDGQERGKEKVFLSHSAEAQSKKEGIFFVLKQGQGLFYDRKLGRSLASFKECRAFFPPSNKEVLYKDNIFIQGVSSSDLLQRCDIESGKELCRRFTLSFFPLLSACVFYNVLWIMGHSFLWAAVLGSVFLLGIVWMTAESLSFFAAFACFSVTLSFLVRKRCRV